MKFTGREYETALKNAILGRETWKEREILREASQQAREAREHLEQHEEEMSSLLDDE